MNLADHDLFAKFSLPIFADTLKIYLACIQQSFPSQSRLTVVSREAKKKQHACASSGPRDHYSELFTRMAALKF